MKRLTFILLACLILTGCTNSLPKAPDFPKLPNFSIPDLPKMPKLSLPSWIKPKLPSIEIYTPSVIQGSVLNITDINLLVLGMSKSSILNIIGSPSISDPFNQDQWDYINHSTNNVGEVNHYRLKLIFKSGLLSKIDKSGLEGLFSSN